MKFRLLEPRAFAFSILIFLVVGTLAQTPPLPSTAVTTSLSDNKAPTGKRGVITGRVLGEDGQPLIGVSVEVFQANTTRNDRHTITTDNDGSFEVKNLPAGAYSIIATVPGFVSAPGNATEGLLRGWQRRYHIGENVTITMIKGGVITGKILDSAGQPQVGAPVWAIRVRDASGRLVNEAQFTGRPGMSDDRGLYRLYGLPGGSYIVYTNGAGELLASLNGTREVPTYYPNATRDIAQEVAVTPGLEVAGIDIRHRGDLGHAVSGTVIVAADNRTTTAMSVYVELLQMGTGTRIATTGVNLRTGNGFAVYGVPDGEYEILALQRAIPTSSASNLVSAPRRVTVRGGDVTGLELRLVALGSITGRVVLEKTPKTDCKITRRGELEEVLLLPRREDQATRRGSLSHLLQDAMPDDKGEFVIRDLEAGRYCLIPQLPSDHWYVKAMTVGATSTKPAAVKAPMSSLAMTGITLKSGETLSGVVISLAEGAASLSGRLEGKTLAARMRVHLVPAEKDAADEVLHYAEVVTRDGTFTFSHLAPGKYWILPRAVPENESDEKPAKPTAWETGARVKLRREAEIANQVLELSLCQRVKDFVVRF